MTAQFITMKFLDKILFFVSVPKCVYCGERLDYGDEGLCKACMEKYLDAKKRNCSICAKELCRCSCTNKYLDSHFMHKHIKVFRYEAGEETPGNMLIYKLKRDNRSDIIDFLASELSEAIKSSVETNENTIITSVPRRRSEKLKYGMDHAELLARKVGKNLSVTYKSLLKSKSRKPQKKTKTSEERLENAKFKLKNDNDLSGKTVILIDDIVTTGASMGACAFQIKTLLPKAIIGASLAIAYKDSYTPFAKDDRFFRKKSSNKIR